MLTETMKVIESEESRPKMRPGTVILSVHLELAPIVEKFRELRRSQGRPEPSLSGLRTAAAIRIRKGLLPIDRIIAGRVIVACTGSLYKELVADVLYYRFRRVQEE